MNVAVESFAVPGSRRVSRGASVTLNISLLKLMSLRVDRLSGVSGDLKEAAWRWLESDAAIAACSALNVDHGAYLAQLRRKAGAV